MNNEKTNAAEVKNSVTSSENANSKKKYYDFPTEAELMQLGREMEIVSHPKVNEMVSEIKKCVCQFDRMMEIDVENFPDFTSKIQAAEERWKKCDELKRIIDIKLREIEVFCKKHEIPLNICIYYPGIYCKATCQIAPAFIYYSLKRGYLVVIDETFKEWANPDVIFDNFDSGCIKKDFYVIPELGIGAVGIQDGIVRIGNFETTDDIPDVVLEYIAHLHHLLDKNNIEVITECI